ncbi:MAG: hypothetical protein DMF60_17920, partial [Acidobacteria bacterium]
MQSEFSKRRRPVQSDASLRLSPTRSDLWVSGSRAFGSFLMFGVISLALHGAVPADDRPFSEGKQFARDKAVITEEDKKWWAFQPLASESLINESVVSSSESRQTVLSRAPTDSLSAHQVHPIDRLLLAKAATKGLALSPAAGKRTLIRRAYLDLLGLPPMPKEIEAFVRETSEDAWPRLIDRLLASPHYGERWARHWLDVARFAESSGFEHDYDREGAFHYRDFVIKALNADMPFDQFARWQIAGDEFEPDNPLALTATGFLGAGVFPTQITANEVERTRYDALDDMLSTTSLAFLGLTVGCARCHDHKYDPIPTTDYYRLLSTFTTTVRSVIDLDLEPETTRKLKQKWATEHSPLVAEVTQYENQLLPRFNAWLSNGGELAQPFSWAVLELTNLVSKGGATFKKLDDGSHLVEGKNADHDEYTLVGSTAGQRVTGVRLDALTHPTMKKGGPGRADNGNIGLSRIRVFAVPVGGGVTQEVRLAKAEADFQQNNEHLSIAAALDNRPDTGWAVDPQFGKDHAAVFTFAEPLDPANAIALIVALEFRVNAKHNIGRPRLSLTTDAVPSLEGEVLPAAVSGLLRQLKQLDHLPLAEQDRSTLFEWWKRRDAGWRDRVTRVEEHAKREPNGST